MLRICYLDSVALALWLPRPKGAASQRVQVVKAPGPYGFWDQKPQILGAWSLWALVEFELDSADK